MKTEFNPIVKNIANSLKDKTTGRVIPKEIMYVDHSLLIGEKADIRHQMLKLEKYLETHPEDIDARTQLGKLRLTYRNM